MQGTTIQIESPEVLKELREIKAELEAIKKEFQPREPTEYLTRNEVRDLLKVNLSTIHHLTKRGILKAYYIGARVYFKRHEVEQAIKPIN